MICRNQLEYKPVGTRFLQKVSGSAKETYIREWSTSRLLVKLADNQWHYVYNIEVLDYLEGLHIDYLPHMVYGKFVPQPFINIIPLDSIQGNTNPLVYETMTFCGNDLGTVSTSTTLKALS